jgi:hypothetical protein
MKIDEIGFYAATFTFEGSSKAPRESLKVPCAERIRYWQKHNVELGWEREGGEPMTTTQNFKCQ